MICYISQLPSDIMKMMDEISSGILYDHTSLYLRPLTKGRGAVHIIIIVFAWVFVYCL